MANNLHGFTRRDFLLTAAATAGAHGLYHMNAIGMTMTLRKLAEDKGVTFASAISSDLFRDAALASLITSQCGIATPENALKWAATRPAPDTFDFSAGDSLCEFSKSHRIQFRG